MENDYVHQMQTLRTKTEGSPGIAVKEYNELVALNIENRQASAAILLQGAQVSHYQRCGEKPLLWLSSLCDYQAGQPLRGGIAICWPWSGQLGNNSEAVRKQVPCPSAAVPAHGFVRARLWSASDIEVISEDLTTVTLQLPVKSTDEPLWPYDSHLHLRLGVGKTLEVSLSVVNQARQPVNFSSVLHSYWAVEDSVQSEIQGLEGVSYVDALQDWRESTQNGPVRIVKELNRIYRDVPANCQLLDRSWQRTIHLSSEGSRSTIVWNPWRERTRNLPDFSDDAYRNMLYIETANALSDCVEPLPGETHTLGVTLSLGAISVVDGENTKCQTKQLSALLILTWITEFGYTYSNV